MTRRLRYFANFWACQEEYMGQIWSKCQSTRYMCGWIQLFQGSSAHNLFSSFSLSKNSGQLLFLLAVLIGCVNYSLEEIMYQRKNFINNYKPKTRF